MDYTNESRSVVYTASLITRSLVMSGVINKVPVPEEAIFFIPSDGGCSFSNNHRIIKQN